MGLVLKFSIVFPLSRYIIQTFVEDFKSISVLRKEISNLEAEKKSVFFYFVIPKIGPHTGFHLFPLGNIAPQLTIFRSKIALELSDHLQLC